MARGGYFAGSDYVPYEEGPLSKSSPTSRREIHKQKTIVCSNCKREVPFKEICIFCDSILF